MTLVEKISWHPAIDTCNRSSVATYASRLHLRLQPSWEQAQHKVSWAYLPLALIPSHCVVYRVDQIEAIGIMFDEQKNQKGVATGSHPANFGEIVHFLIQYLSFPTSRV